MRTKISEFWLSDQLEIVKGILGQFSDKVLADTPASTHAELPMLALQVFTDVGAPVVPPVIDQPVIMDGLVCKDKRMDEVSVFSGSICVPPIHIGTWDMELSHGDTEWVCLLYSTGAGSVDDGTVVIGLDGQRLDHWRGVVWDPGIVGQPGLSVCYDCLSVMSLVHDWTEWSVWIETVSGYCRPITWQVGYSRRFHPPCDVDRLCDYMARQIKGSVVVVMTDRNENNSPQRCTCTRGIPLGVLSAGRIPIMVIGRIGCGAVLYPDSRGLDQNFRQFRSRNCHCFASSGHLRSVTWCGSSRT